MNIDSTDYKIFTPSTWFRSIESGKNDYILYYYKFIIQIEHVHM